MNQPTQLTCTEVMNIIHTAIKANEAAGRSADCATMIGALNALLVVEEAQYLGAIATQLRKESK